jgi:hypothetical protein
MLAMITARLRPDGVAIDQGFRHSRRTIEAYERIAAPARALDGGMSDFDGLLILRN